MAIEVKVSSFRRQVLIALVVFGVCALTIVLVKISKKFPKLSSRAEPISQEPCDVIHREIVVERDVEVNLLEPLLLKLGFNRHDWVRQLPVRVGRGEKTFPDYALKVEGTGDNVTAQYIWEAKYSISSDSQLLTDFNQARSYALLLQAKALCLVSKEGVWFESRDPKFAFDLLRHFTWAELSEEKNVDELRMCFLP